MPYKTFLEEYSLYRKFRVRDMPSRTDEFPETRINMECPHCKSNQTFGMTNTYWENCQYSNYPVSGIVFRMVYLCGHCQQFERVFYIKVSDDNDWLMKVGQYPPWDIKGNVNLERLLGRHADYYRKGLVCESQGYGIGAFSYYRRIVEEIIDGLLDEIAELLTDVELSAYQDALAKTKETKNTQEKVDLVKDLLPPILRPEGINPLSALHSSLSEGLHANSDEECLEYAENCREILIFLVNQVVASKASAKGFTTSMRKLLDKKSTKKD